MICPPKSWTDVWGAYQVEQASLLYPQNIPQSCIDMYDKTCYTVTVVMSAKNNEEGRRWSTRYRRKR